MRTPSKLMSAGGPCAVLWFVSLVACGDGGGSKHVEDGGYADDGAVEDEADPNRDCSEDSDCDTGFSCVSGSCQASACLVGDTGCACGPDDTCLRDSDLCTDDKCVPEDCTAGDENCPCTDGTCNAGLFCAGDLCVDATGYAGSACLPNNRCHAGYACDAWLDVCVPCEAGTQGCQCGSEGGCNLGLSCVGDVCAPDTGIIPQNPVCYTPCGDDNLDGTIRCDADGLAEGCFDGLVCAEGSSSCVSDGDEAPTCSDDFECTDYQVCLSGHCYSNCAADNDCPQGLGCSRKVCRLGCLTSDPDGCPSRYQCKARDGLNGYCHPISEGSGDAQPEVGGTYKLVPEVLTFSNVRTHRSFEIQLTSEFDQTLTVRKVAHRVNWDVGGVESVQKGADDDCSGAECPLWWLGVNGDKGRSVDIEITASGKATIDLTSAGDPEASAWDGVLEISSQNMDTQTLTLSYARTEDGRWAGTITYFGKFGTDGIGMLQSDPDQVANGLLQRWNAFKTGNMDGFEEFKAVLESTSTGSFDWPATQKDCSVSPQGRCYLYTPSSGSVVTSGLVPYVTNVAQTPVPVGVVDFPFAMDMYRDPFGKLRGRIASSIAMHYPGNAPISMKFRGDSQDPGSFVNVGDDKVLYLESFGATVSIGGRTVPASGGSCPSSDFVADEVPWLLPGFDKGVTERDGGHFVSECRDVTAPRIGTSDAVKILNKNLSAANPVLDGRSRTRTLSLLDGALINQDELFILFREDMDPLADGGEPLSAYGYLRLKRVAADLLDSDDNGVPDAFEGDNADDTPVIKESQGAASTMLTCDAEVSGDGTLAQRAYRLILGRDTQNPDPEATRPEPVADDLVQYLCADTGRFAFKNVKTDVQDCAPPSSDAGGVSGDVQAQIDDYLASNPNCDLSQAYCPPGSTVEYFILKDEDLASMVYNDSCNDDGSCAAVLEQWKADVGSTKSPIADGGVDPAWTCKILDSYGEPVEDQVNGVGFEPLHCDSNRVNLREGRNFYLDVETAQTKQVYLPIRAAIEEAFRYKTRFTTRSGASVGFAPEICIPDSDQIRYCYDPDEIQQILDRVDCLLDLYRTDGTNDLVNTYLGENFGVEVVVTDEQGNDLAFPRQNDGFEKLYAELMIMLGDESLTRAYSSRFDLAGTGGAAFLGSQFEEGGIDLTGVAGFEMYSLYQAAQYYQSVLDRFYRMTEVMWRALNKDISESQNFITPETVTAYLDRVIRASTQLARTWSEVAKHYQSFNRADLARRVIERAYTRTYLESVILTSLIKEVDRKSSAAIDAQLEQMITDGVLRYQVALRKMRIVYDSLTDDVTFFGFAPNYVPFPALDTNLVNANAFETLLNTVRNKVDVAAQREANALSSNRSLALDNASFQAELTRIKNTYENQLADICGTFVADVGGGVYPAIDTYAHLSEKARAFGDPCGLMGNGRLAAAIRDGETALLAQKDALAAIDSVIGNINIELERAKEQCEHIEDLSDFIETRGNQRIDLQQDVRIAETWKGRAERWLNTAVSTFEVSAEVGGAGVLLAMGAVTAATEAGAIASEEILLDKQKDLDEKNLEIEVNLKRSECETVQIDSRANIKRTTLELTSAMIGSARAVLNTRNAMAEVVRLGNEAVRLRGMQQQEEALAINVEAARNDPNVRIYRNDAVLNADIAFEDALQGMYRLTLVYEYYTSQTYALRNELFLTRMVSSGDSSLQNYLLGLTNAFYEFEEEFGNPDQRVMVLSLRDDILRIPRIGEDGKALAQEDRLKRFHEALADSKWLNRDGYISFPFATRLDRVSPLTRNHKILYLESQIFGSSVGDKVARVYVQQTGTGVVRDVDDELDYYRMPDKTAVINPFFASRTFDASVYRNFRLRDRPLINSTWNLVLNMRNEYENQDIDLQGVDDVWVYLYYTDFTSY